MEQLELPGFEKLTRLMVEGVVYTAQRRKCGKVICKCVSGDPDDLHGPYWYGRSALGEVSYVGKRLPEKIVLAWSNMQSQRPFLQEKIERLYEDMRTLQAEIEALRLLEQGGQLSQKQKLWVEALGFYDCLVSPGELPASQDNGGLEMTRMVKSFH